MKKIELINYLNDYLDVNSFNDDSNNGLQVDSSNEEVFKIGYAVDATNYIFEKAINEKIDFLITHHGLYRNDTKLITGLHYQRIKSLIENNISLYASHLPLDAHNEVGNNIGLMKGFCNCFNIGKENIKAFGEYNGMFIGYMNRWENKIPIASVISYYAEKMQLNKTLFNFGKKEYIKSVGIISGGGAKLYIEAKKENLDLFISGEGSHGDIIGAKDTKQSILLGGHRETEKIGIKLLANHLEKKFGIETKFIDEKR